MVFKLVIIQLRTLSFRKKGLQFVQVSEVFFAGKKEVIRSRSVMII